MRIISSFHDYYDTIMGFGVDQTKIFNRETVESKLFPTILDRSKRGWRHNKTEEFPDGHQANSFNLNNFKFEFNAIYVLFAGKLYGGLQFTERKGPLNLQVTSFIWTEEDFNLCIEPLKEDLEEFSRKYYRREDFISEAKRILAIKGNEIFHDWSIENKISIAAFIFKSLRTNDFTLLNPKLSDFNFQKVLDPYTAYQELDMWISGILTNNDNIPDVSNEVKVQQHGFDKWSFRKHKLDNTKERKK